MYLSYGILFIQYFLAKYLGKGKGKGKGKGQSHENGKEKAH